MKSYTEAAQLAHTQLMPLLESATADAQDRLSKATSAADREGITQKFAELVSQSPTPPPEAVGGIIATYAAMLGQPAMRNGSGLMSSLCSSAQYHSLTGEQSAHIAGAIIAAIHGKAPMSLIEWPAADAWHKIIGLKDLQQWAAWLAPEQHAQLMTAIESTAKARISAENDLLQLKRARQSLTGLVPQQVGNEFMRVKNNAGRAQGVAGVRWQAGEVLNVSPTDYGRIVVTDGFKQLIESGQLELVA
jgi:hypothetical protein